MESSRFCRLPTDTQTQGPQQAQNSMTSDAGELPRDRTLLQQSNNIQYGNLLTLPIADGGILYVEPLYTERNTTSTSTFPQLTRVLVSYREPGSDGGVRVGYAARLSEALDQVFGSGTGTAATAPGGDAADPQPSTDSGEAVEAEGNTGEASVGTPNTAPTPQAPLATAAEVQELNDALAEVRAAQQSGDLGRLGDAFRCVAGCYRRVQRELIPPVRKNAPITSSRSDRGVLLLQVRTCRSLASDGRENGRVRSNELVELCAQAVLCGDL